MAIIHVVWGTLLDSPEQQNEMGFLVFDTEVIDMWSVAIGNCFQLVFIRSFKLFTYVTYIYLYVYFQIQRTICFPISFAIILGVFFLFFLFSLSSVFFCYPLSKWSSLRIFPFSLYSICVTWSSTLQSPICNTHSMLFLPSCFRGYYRLYFHT